MGVQPESELEKIICDADCAHIGSKNFTDYTSLLRKEWELTKDYIISDSKWNTENILFLTSHKYYTVYAAKNWGKARGKNLAQLLKKQKKRTFDHEVIVSPEQEQVLIDNNELIQDLTTRNEEGFAVVGEDLVKNARADSSSSCATLCPIPNIELQHHVHVKGNNAVSYTHLTLPTIYSV